MRHLDGFVSANLHIGLDGRHVADYAQWRSVEAFEAMQADPAAREHMAAPPRWPGSPRPSTGVASVHTAGDDDQ